LAIVIGFLGTLFIIQPGAATFDITTAFVLIAAVGMALRDITTKLGSRQFFNATSIVLYVSTIYHQR
jgi:drug/metabolite transporter (DMT)-like permease